ncbi:hypothetical protein [uncultured Arcticibacterium sp.]|uniref:hypothetical protein n=1 Tax=uncultured Arcticibacterium sp. TaxID=2173042 RepID=UPI0030F92B54
MLDLFFSFISKYPGAFFESACILIPLALGLIRWQLLSQEFKLIWIYTVILAVTDIPLWWTALQSINNYRWSNFQEILISGWLFFVFFKILDGVSIKALYIIYMIFAIIIFYDFNWIDYSGKIFSFDRLLFIGFSFMFFYELLEKLEVVDLLRYPKFWFFTGTLISSLGTLFMFVFSEYASYTYDYFSLFRYLKDSFKYIFVFCLTIALFLDNRNLKPKIY